MNLVRTDPFKRDFLNLPEKIKRSPEKNLIFFFDKPGDKNDESPRSFFDVPAYRHSSLKAPRTETTYRHRRPI